jgi:acyl phosphate:glycerol-3-phosphate acyltransferase
MPEPASTTLLVVAAYAVGAIPWAYFVTKWVAGVDLRTVGSGNVGATNASRVLGRKWFLVVFALDAAKGVAPVLWFPALAPSGGADGVRVACGLAAVLGHVFNPFLRFKGGKGVATAAGVIAALAWRAALGAFGVFALVLVAFRYVSLASIVAALALAPLAWAFGESPWVVAFGALTALVVVARHRPNVARIAAGAEPRVFAKKEVGGG